jgi:MSHA biogenesis protein MshJ
MRHIDGLSIRERVFVFAAILMVVGAAWEGLLNGPLSARTQAARERIAATSQRLTQLDEAIAIAAAGLDGGVSDRVQVLQSLREAVATRDAELRVFTSDLVDPAQMRLVVEDLINRQRGLELVSTHNQPATALIETDDPSDANAAAEPNLYLHGLVIELEGSYLELLRYLESIEALPWRIFFSRLDLESIEHPRLKIRLELNTLSLEEEWLGV